MDITYFNWDEIWRVSRGDLAAIIILTYAQTKLYNEISAKTLMSRLGINHIPPSLFHNKTLIQYKNQLICNYKTQEPQSYFINPSFLFSLVPARNKAVYIKALGMRRISSSDVYIPKKYFDNINPNPFVEITEDRIIFKPESSLLRNNTTMNQRSIKEKTNGSLGQS
jgi:hypothetical protein